MSLSHQLKTIFALLIICMVPVILYNDHYRGTLGLIKNAFPSKPIALADWNGEKFWRLQNPPAAPAPSSTTVSTTSAGAPEALPKGHKILVLSTVGRSGSSFLGELIAQLPDSLYFFEPMMFNSKATPEGVNARVTWDLLKNIFSCRFDHDWLVFARRRSLVRKKEGKPCARSRAEGAGDCLRKLCLNQTNIVVKVIRMRVSWLADLLLESGPELKVVHLVRDPRASFRSSRMFVQTQKDYTELCPRILEDLQMIDTVKRLFPGRVTSVKYEDLCLDPKGVVTDLWGFLSGARKAALPPAWALYLAEHTDGANTRGNAYSTWRDTRKEAEAWRQEIGESLLLAVEEHCGGAIALLGHNKFHSLANARNISFPLRWAKKPLYTLI
ncbi:carbohydrate sulfotransferase 5-like [Penaeus chinensis]|uniref:carbohydrate sulfotransferase 5-like n=1 Tax=Penaeus chinensis TaxID=139456 RepID=UPI001FB66AF2|nr:carbohydrate sulfotransferase 5-like [Penaeus chinensis]XP_047491756.1 carbohydrate sulfotransferase 5-like [Penaeus chinensis]XP_047491757.1 carbohydrate sulfotransferase 5-like [Penaeus chinensis]XP_047491758.1 carbohydrate sulfotransferase 5-like [Penaeus chinensis]